MPCIGDVFFLMIRRPPRSTLDRSSAASDVYKRQSESLAVENQRKAEAAAATAVVDRSNAQTQQRLALSLIHISEPTRPY